MESIVKGLKLNIYIHNFRVFLGFTPDEQTWWGVHACMGN